MGPFASAARKFVRKGIPVIPLVPNDKRPLIKKGLKGASKNLEEINRWISKWPDANIGIPTGDLSGLIVVDVDKSEEKDGLVELRRLQEENGRIPRTVYSRTPRGGLHIYFRNPGVRIKSRTNHPGKGIDVRGNGGYVVVPPSTINGRSYAYGVEGMGKRPVELPGWLLDLLKEKPFIPQPRKEYTPLESNLETEKIIHALQFIGASDYHTWVRVGMALHSFDPGGNGYSLFDSWSSGGKGYDPKAVKSKWSSFGKGAGSVSISTLFYLARQNGWRIKEEHKSSDFKRHC